MVDYESTTGSPPGTDETGGRQLHDQDSLEKTAGESGNAGWLRNKWVNNTGHSRLYFCIIRIFIYCVLYFVFFTGRQGPGGRCPDVFIRRRGLV